MNNSLVKCSRRECLNFQTPSPNRLRTTSENKENFGCYLLVFVLSFCLFLWQPTKGFKFREFVGHMHAYVTNGDDSRKGWLLAKSFLFHLFGPAEKSHTYRLFFSDFFVKSDICCHCITTCHNSTLRLSNKFRRDTLKLVRISSPWVECSIKC